ncbi:MAG: ATP-binding protein [Gammaproteobacteria bacterium]|nr:ATP-binding protein [Gammaproteobacteria bacterium]
MSLRLQLLLVSLLTLVLPWAGCQYVRETEDALRRSHTGALLGNAQAVARQLANRQDLIYPDPRLAEPITGAVSVYQFSLHTSPTLDGFVEDWVLDPDGLSRLYGGIRAVHYALGMGKRFAWLFLQVTDSQVVYATSDSEGDSVLLIMEDSNQELQAYRFSTLAPGQVFPQRSPLHRPWQGGDRETRIQGEWQPTGDGFNLEIRIPREMLGARLGFLLKDQGADGASIGTMDPTRPEPAMIVRPSAELAAALAPYHRPGLLLRVGDRQGWELARYGEIGTPPQRDIADASAWLDRLYQVILGTGDLQRAATVRAGRLPPEASKSALSGQAAGTWNLLPEGDRAVATVFAPIEIAGQAMGSVVVEQDSEAILTLTNNALRRLMNLTLIAVCVAALGLLGLASLLAFRIRRLKNAAESAVSADGRILGGIPGTDAGDEIGDLSRSFAAMLERLRGYHQYMETLASKLSHELRTPLAVVHSSLENLEHEELSDESREYTRRALDGSNRLKRILNAMSEASRVEASIKGAAIESLDLSAWIKDIGEAYQSAYPHHEIRVATVNRPCVVQASPDLLAQLMDKLVDNAADFAADGSWIRIALSRAEKSCCITVSNPGPPLPEELQGQLFDSMVSRREKKGAKPHLGLGLYIVRLITQFHGGEANAENLPRDGGVIFSITLPLAKPLD